MRVNRRFVLRGMAVSGVAGWFMQTTRHALAGTAAMPVAAAAGRPLLALVNDDTAGAVFLRGAKASSGTRLQVSTASRELAFLLGVERRLRSGPSMRVIGLLDDAAATLVLDLARGAGARLAWLGHHTAEGGTTRHQLRITDNASGYAQAFGRQLRASGAAFEITEEREGGRAPPRRTSAPPRSIEPVGTWAFGLGGTLASMDPQQATSVAPSLHDAPDFTGRFVSFLIDV